MQRVNPSVKLLVSVVCMMLTLLTREPIVMALLLTIPLLATWLFGGVPLLRIAKRLAPFLIFFLMYVWMQGAFARIPNAHVLYEFLWYRVSVEGLMVGLTVALRMLVFVSYGILCATTTDVTLFVLSLMQQLRVPPKLAYGLMAGFRFVPMFKSEMEQIRLAHRIRGMDRQPGLRGRWEMMKRFTIPLLAQAIRKAERVAIAMESKGFDGSRDRTFYRQVKTGPVDAIFAGVVLGLNGILLFS
ncbi:cobalt transporter [Effusibacillus lacus]|uniref:Cobalt transporter n=1 Tax=Effusibacillus lacus TaxID=1348429 RepID=A0A292YNT4_9BACL|nr:cobalt transporter [Effusibacillus lacus]